MGRRTFTFTFQNCGYVSTPGDLGADDIAYLVDHVALWVPTLVPHIAIDLYKLLENGAIASSTLRSETRGIMIMTIDISLVFVVGVLRAEKGGTNGACEMVDMELFIYSSQVVQISKSRKMYVYVLHAVI